MHRVKSFDIDGLYTVYETAMHQDERPVHGTDGQPGVALVDGRDVSVVYDSSLQMWATPAFKDELQKTKALAVA